MVRRISCVAAAVAMFTLAGCGGADSVMKEQIALLNEMADAVEKNEGEAKIKDIQSRMKANDDKYKALKLTPDQETKLHDKYKTEMLEVSDRLRKAGEKRAADKKAAEGK
jgi:hypothetical protein